MEMLGQAVLIKPDKLPERTKTGNLYIPRNSREMLPEWGTVIGCGKACENIEVGMHLMFPRKSASVIVIDDTDHYITSEHRIFYMREKLNTQK
jgi:co-chaperonin GroES (HSP10)